MEVFKFSTLVRYSKRDFNNHRLISALQLVILRPAIRPEKERGAPILKLLTDPYILVAAGSPITIELLK